MPLEDAMRFVGQNFDRYMQDLRERSKKSSLSSLETGSASSGTAPAPTPSKQGSEISDLLSRAASGETLSSDQLSRLIDNLSKQQKEISGAVGANGGQGGNATRSFVSCLSACMQCLLWRAHSTVLAFLVVTRVF